MNHRTMFFFGLATALLMLVPSGESEAQQNRQTRQTRQKRQKRQKRWERTCQRIYVRSPEATSAKSKRAKPVFEASGILDLELQVVFPRRLNGNHDVELKLYTPNGNLYQAIPVPFNADPETEHTRRSRRPRPTAEATLPVAGTSIVTSSLYGTWRVEAHLDGSDLSCTRPTKFVLQP